MLLPLDLRQSFADEQRRYAVRQADFQGDARLVQADELLQREALFGGHLGVQWDRRAVGGGDAARGEHPGQYGIHIARGPPPPGPTRSESACRLPAATAA